MTADWLTTAINVSRHWASFYADLHPLLRPEWDDMVQEGIIAALIAMPRYQPEHGTPMTYLYPRIRGGIVDYLRKRDPLTRNHRNAIRNGEAPDPGITLSVESLLNDPALHSSLLDEVEDQDAIRRALDDVKARHPEHLGLITDWLRDDGTTQVALGARHGYTESRTSQIIRRWLRELEHTQEAT